MTILAKNKQARFNYEIVDTLEAGIVLEGQEVKSAKAGNVSLKGSYVSIRPRISTDENQRKSEDSIRGNQRSQPEVWLINAHITPYKKASQLEDYNPTRERKLLLKKSEISGLIGKSKQRGMALMPLQMKTRRGLVKVVIGIGRGKKKQDKRESIKKRETVRRIRRALRGH